MKTKIKTIEFTQESPAWVSGRVSGGAERHYLKSSLIFHEVDDQELLLVMRPEYFKKRKEFA